MRFLLGFAFAFGVFGCPPAEKTEKAGGADASSTVPSICAKIGQSCELSPGKLGTCVQKDDCKEATACFVCQSQH